MIGIPTPISAFPHAHLVYCLSCREAVFLRNIPWLHAKGYCLDYKLAFILSFHEGPNYHIAPSYSPGALSRQ